MTGISDGTATSYSYDGAGNRLRAVRSGTATRYIYDAVGNLLAEADSSNTIVRYYVHGAGLLAAVTPANAVYCYHFDGVGSTVAITDSSQSVVNSYAYTPFGMLLNESESFAQPFKYVGGLCVMAEANGFYYMRARYYDPVVGRFISEDPLGFGGGDVNLFVYAQNNPVMRVDPWGLKVGDWWDLPANFGRAQEIAREERQNRPGQHNDAGDAMRHAEWNRRMAEETNSFTAWIAGVGHEVDGLLQGQPLNEAMMDLHNNAEGRAAGNAGRPVAPNNLRTSPTTTSNNSPYFPSNPKPLKKILFTINGIIVTFLIICEISCIPRKNDGEFILINNSNYLIRDAKIEICNQLIKINNIKQNEKVTGTFKITSDSHYKAVIFFASGKTLSDEFGYVTRGFNIKDTISVTDFKIVIIDTETE